MLTLCYTILYYIILYYIILYYIILYYVRLYYSHCARGSHAILSSNRCGGRTILRITFSGCSHTRKGGWYGRKPSSSSNFSLRELFELKFSIRAFEFILLLNLDKQLPVEQFKATVSQSTAPLPPLSLPAGTCTADARFCESRSQGVLIPFGRGTGTCAVPPHIRVRASDWHNSCLTSGVY